jgi:hypothetical protein
MPPIFESELRYPVCMQSLENSKSLNRAIGLCASCRQARRIESSRGSIFYLCLRSATDPAFAKYPRLPMLTCGGYEST